MEGHAAQIYYLPERLTEVTSGGEEVLTSPAPTRIMHCFYWIVKIHVQQFVQQNVQQFIDTRFVGRTLPVIGRMSGLVLIVPPALILAEI